MEYSYKGNEKSARAMGVNLGISTKYSVEVCSFIRGKKLAMVKKMLENVTLLKQAVPLKRYNADSAHRKGMCSGSYPVNACADILKIVKSAEANAQFKGLSVSDLIVKHAVAQLGTTTQHAGRHGGRAAKRTHIEIVLEESKK